jgi:hypothetical protein
MKIKSRDRNGFLALRFESFHSQILKIQFLSTLASSSKGWVVHELPLAIYQKNESKDNPWDV